MKNRILRQGLPIILLPFVFSGCFKTRNEIAREKEEQEVRSNLQQNIVEYNQGLEKTQAQLGKLEGRIEELEHIRKKEMSGLQSGREAEQKTLQELRSEVSALREGQQALFEEIKKLKEDNLAVLSDRGVRAATPAPAGAKKKAIGASFEEALAAYKAKNFQGAADGFRAFLDTKPKGKKAIDAHFYLGESLFREKEYSAAVVELAVVHEKSPTSNLGRQSTLRLAQSFKAMGKDKDAKAFAQLLVQAAPTSKEAAQARKLLK